MPRSKYQSDPKCTNSCHFSGHFSGQITSSPVDSAAMLASPIAPTTLQSPCRTMPWDGSHRCEHMQPRCPPLVSLVPLALCAGSLQSYSRRKHRSRATARSHGVDPITDPAHHRVWEGWESWENWRIGWNQMEEGKWPPLR